jgi:hypothetical protein
MQNPYSPRRFPPPWSPHVVRDANKQQIAYVYYENEPGRRSAAKLLTKDEARRIAANIAKLPGAIARSFKRRSDSYQKTLFFPHFGRCSFGVGRSSF